MAQQDVKRYQGEDRNRADQEAFSDYGSQSREMTTKDRADAEGMPAAGQGNWTGYVVPYRYYGPGYRGVGYYSVMYQGPGEDEDGSTGSTGNRYGQQTGAGGGWS